MVDENSIMPSGQYAGTPLKDVPANYLCWCLKFNKLPASVKPWVEANLDKLAPAKPGCSATGIKSRWRG